MYQYVKYVKVGEGHFRELVESHKNQIFIEYVGEQLLLFILVCVAVGIWLITRLIKKKTREKRIAALEEVVVSFGANINTYVSFFTLEHEYQALVRKIEKEILGILGEKIILRHLDTLLTKRKQLLYIDDYGLEIRDKWDKELSYFAVNVLFPNLETEYYKLPIFFEFVALSTDPRDKVLLEAWCEFTDEFLRIREADRKQEVSILYDPNMSGLDYEQYVADLLDEHGWSAQVTAASGDYGADVIATKDDVKAAIQCKFYSGSVGNQSVQEAYAGKGFYDCDLAVVVSNSTFTPSAKQAANKLNVILMHHDELSKL